LAGATFIIFVITHIALEAADPAIMMFLSVAQAESNSRAKPKSANKLTRALDKF
jgi:hypothetical protein